jgi:hypothetical protein
MSSKNLRAGRIRARGATLAQAYRSTLSQPRTCPFAEDLPCKGFGTWMTHYCITAGAAEMVLVQFQ